MRIVLDLQGCQTASRLRGIGRQALGLAKAMVARGHGHEFLIAANGLLPLGLEALRQEFSGLLPADAIRVWVAPGPVCEAEPANTERRKAAEMLREALLASLAPDVVHISSLFEGYPDDGVTSIGGLAAGIPTALTLHDLIPLISPQEHRDHPRYAAYYQGKIAHLRHADLLLAVSESARREALQYLEFAPAAVVNISSATDSSFRPLDLTPERRAAECQRLGITRPFVLYVGTADKRKNLPRLVRSFALLPPALRQAHQLVIAGNLGEEGRWQIDKLARQAGLGSEDIHLMAGVSDADLILLNNLCRLAVMPSLHEGFGLPVLEAMACGAAVIAANATSLPEVVGRTDALFDPVDEHDMMRCIARVLESADLRQDLARWGLQRAALFSFDASADRALAALATLAGRRDPLTLAESGAPAPRPRLAFVSPMPPERSGIADYSVDLVLELRRHYDIEIVSPQEALRSGTDIDLLALRTPAWFLDHAHRYQRVVYQVGNSPHHSHIFELVGRVPGVVTLHDFFLSSVLRYDEANHRQPHAWTRELIRAHGYPAAVQAHTRTAVEDATLRYPVNASVLQYADGVIVHSEAARALARTWYDAAWSAHWVKIPLARKPASAADAVERRAQARASLGISDQVLLVCSFGMLAPTKLNHRLLAAWKLSSLARDRHCRLVFVGENEGGAYGQALLEQMKRGADQAVVEVTGWASATQFRLYLEAADVAVQLRALNRGETSATVLDCMSHGLPTIVNAHGSMAELPADGVALLPDAFTDAQLVEQLERLGRDSALRSDIGGRARRYIEQQHDPAYCAARYREAIEAISRRAALGPTALIAALAQNSRKEVDEVELARSIARNHPLPRLARQVFIDITATARNGLRTGIERFVRALCCHAIDGCGSGVLLRPVYLSSAGGRWHYRHAHRYTLDLLGVTGCAIEDAPADWQQGDVLLIADISGNTLTEASRAGLFGELRTGGVSLYAVAHDLLPMRLPHHFPPGADREFAKWLSCILAAVDGLLAVSQAVCTELAAYVAEHAASRSRPVRLAWFHHGGDLPVSGSLIAAADQAYAGLLPQWQLAPSFLMVGTLEPRKGHMQALAAFDLLWQSGLTANLLIVGSEGWRDLPAASRQPIAQLVERIRRHPQFGRSLFWLPGIGDGLLEQIYAAADCLIAASEGEGFGLPLLEAAHHGLPILARDIPVFREVAGAAAQYFSGTDPVVLAESVQDWLAHPERRNPAALERISHPATWRASARRVLDIVLQR